MQHQAGELGPEPLQEPGAREEDVALHDLHHQRQVLRGALDVLEGVRKEAEDLLTPVDIEGLYNSNQGSIYGVVSDWKLNKGFKAPKQSSRYRNLFFTGGSVNPGGGMPMAILCGQKVSDRVVACDDKNRS